MIPVPFLALTLAAILALHALYPFWDPLPPLAFLWAGYGCGYFAREVMATT